MCRVSLSVQDMRLPVIIINDCWEYIIELELERQNSNFHCLIRMTLYTQQPTDVINYSHRCSAVFDDSRICAELFLAPLLAH